MSKRKMNGYQKKQSKTDKESLYKHLEVPNQRYIQHDTTDEYIEKAKLNTCNMMIDMNLTYAVFTVHKDIDKFLQRNVNDIRTKIPTTFARLESKKDNLSELIDKEIETHLIEYYPSDMHDSLDVYSVININDASIFNCLAVTKHDKDKLTVEIIDYDVIKSYKNVA